MLRQPFVYDAIAGEIFSFVRTCALRRKLKRNFCEIALSFKPPAWNSFGFI